MTLALNLCPSPASPFYGSSACCAIGLMCARTAFLPRFFWGSGILFLAMFFAATAVAGAMILVLAAARN